MPTLDEQMATIDAALVDLAETGVKSCTLAIAATLVEETPVDTGNARANWLPSVAVPRESPVGSRDAVDASGQAQGLSDVAGYKFSDGPAYVTNPVSYIGQLDQGSSTQAPAGFIGRAIDRAIVEAQADAAGGIEILRDRNAEFLALLGAI